MSDGPFIELPQDQYAHAWATSEWWWHIGTLRCGDRVFGFEITASGYPINSPTPFAMTQIMLTDVANQRHYQQTTPFVPYPVGFAQADPRRPWYVGLAGAPFGSGDVVMRAPKANPLSMSVQAMFSDGPSAKEIGFKLHFQQEAAPMLIWGTGRSPVPAQGGEYNYYYSLTHLQATGEILIGDEVVPVTGLTWMDHEFGGFPSNTMWVLQNMQLDNGVHIMNFASNTAPVNNQAITSNATVLTPDGTSTYYENGSTCTPQDPWESGGITYYLTWLVSIPALDASFEVKSLMPDQLFSWESPVYEGVAHSTGSIAGMDVSGTAWIEQRLPPPPPSPPSNR